MKLKVSLATAVVALAFAGPAHADDASLFSAFNDTAGAERDAASAEYKDAYKDLKDGSTDEEVARILAVNERISELAKQTKAAVEAQEPSTDKGVKAKKLTIRQLDYFLRVQMAEIRGDRAFIAHEDKKAGRYYRKSNRMYRRYMRMCKQTNRAYKQAGFKLTR